MCLIVLDQKPSRGVEQAKPLIIPAAISSTSAPVVKSWQPPTVTELFERLDWHENRLRKVEDRVDRLYAQSRVFTIHSEALDKKWKDLGDLVGPGQMAAQGEGEVWLEEVCKALGVQWPLSRDEPTGPEMFTMACGHSPRKYLVKTWCVLRPNGEVRTGQPEKKNSSPWCTGLVTQLIVWNDI